MLFAVLVGRCLHIVFYYDGGENVYWALKIEAFRNLQNSAKVLKIH
jgi:hypothetical protein